MLVDDYRRPSYKWQVGSNHSDNVITVHKHLPRWIKQRVVRLVVIPLRQDLLPVNDTLSDNTIPHHPKLLVLAL